ncbi:MAG: hypothetical protein JWP18_1597 [Solirubrobacterales bacterium]|nr:hypothetical protein [Solirubrobacterales bacterium]
MKGGIRRRVALGLALGPALLVAGAVPVAGAPTPQAATAPACFGAAARDVTLPCENPSLRYKVTPKPEDAELQPGSRCKIIATKGEPTRVCEFGFSKRAARSTVALLGDSHAPAWRGAVAGLVRAQRWRGLTIRRSSCPFTTTPRFTDDAGSAACFAWVRAATTFLFHHPEVHTLFVATSSAYFFKPGPDGDVHTAAVRGFREAFDALPPSVRHVVVVRDNPQARDDTLGCVADAMARGRRADLRCALPRNGALLPDAAAEAATQLQGGRGRAIDLTSVFCDASRCYPVVGGALVYRDRSHLTQTFSASLGPLLVRAYRALGLPPA